jgi:ubiquitin conjugation factor E4 B
MIEKKFKHEYDSSYKQIRKVIANYITLIMSSPLNFDILNLDKKAIQDHLTKYLQETDEFELGFFLMDLYNSTSTDISSLAFIFGFFFEIIHNDNLQSKPNFFNTEKIRKNMNLLTSLFTNCPLAAQAWVQEKNFTPQVQNGKIFQFYSHLSPYIMIAPFESDNTMLRNSLPSNKSHHETEAIIKSYTNKLNDYLNELLNFIYSIFNSNKEAREGLLNWIFTLISQNMDKLKLYQSQQTTSTLGYLINVLYIMLKIFFDQFQYMETFTEYSDFIFYMVSKIDPLFTISNNKINFSKFDRVNADLVKEIIENENMEQDNKEWSLQTYLYFICSTLITFTIKPLDDELGHLGSKLQQLEKEGKSSDLQFKDLSSIYKVIQVYTRNPELTKNIMKFNEITCIFLFSLNNKKYPQFEMSMMNKKIDYSQFLQDFYQYIFTNDNFALSLLPNNIIKNTYQTLLFVRKYNPDMLLNEINCTKILIYLSLIYSSQVELIKNPHLRAELFDILLYLFVLSPDEKKQKFSAILRLSNEDYVRENIIYSIMRVFIDAERLGTSNQFFEKFSIRHKVLYVIENLMKTNKQLYTQKLINYAEESSEEATKMINLLMNDLIYLNDECIEKLGEIKKYQDLKDDVLYY